MLVLHKSKDDILNGELNKIKTNSKKLNLNL